MHAIHGFFCTCACHLVVLQSTHSKEFRNLKDFELWCPKKSGGATSSSNCIESLFQSLISTSCCTWTVTCKQEIIVFTASNKLATLPSYSVQLFYPFKYPSTQLHC